MRLMGRAQQLLLEHWAGHAGATRPLPPDPFGLMPLGAKVLAGLTADAEALAERNAALMRRLTALWTQAEAEAEVEAGKPDRRFAAPEWQSHMVFDLARQSYLLASEHWLAAVD
ncbi:MAG TPA: class I poly(R)-hydroxyalkanoic acid synthase, partial [Pedomonas sp.]|nr:class I poly(R)-hydroxyalkanoic acid synthase [Pedomonas sp.]